MKKNLNSRVSLVTPFIVLSFLMSSFLYASFSMMNEEIPYVTSLPVEKIFSITHGFDTTDMTEVAVHGYLPDTCHMLNKGVAQIDHVNKKIFVNIEGYVKREAICLPLVTPYLEVIHLGPLKAGDYEIASVQNQNVMGALNVALSAFHEQDDHLYAPVDTVELVAMNSVVADKPYQELTLKGTYPYTLRGCMRLFDVKTYTTDNDVLVVLPISELMEEGDCDLDDVDDYNRFEVKHKVDDMILGKGLLHVRTLHGGALNKFVNFTKGF